MRAPMSGIPITEEIIGKIVNLDEIDFVLI